MNRRVPLLSAAGVLGALCAGVLTFHAVGRAQDSAANVEAPTGDAKADEANVPANDTEILASQGATFAAKDRIAVFIGDVRVRDPRFTLACDKLTVYLAKTAAPGASPSPGNTPPPIDPAAKPDADKASGIDHAVAEGHVIIIKKNAPTKPGEEEKISIGRCDIGEFDNKTGDMTLRGMPKVEQNGDSHEALSRSTYMILHKDNSLETHGPSRTIIRPRGKDGLPGSSPGSKPAGSPPAGSPSGRHTPASGT